MRFRFEAQLLAGTRRDEEAGIYVCHAPALNLFSQGETQSDAVQAIQSAIKLYLVTAHEEGLLDQLLRRHGFSPMPGQGTAPAASADQYIGVLEEKHFEHFFEVQAPVEFAHA